MRFVVLLFGFAGCLLTTFIGCIFFALDQGLKFLHDNGINTFDPLFAADSNPQRTGIFLLIGAGLGLIGTLLGFFRCGWQGALLLAVPIAGPAILNPLTLAGTSLQGFTALVSLFVRPSPITPAEAIEDD